jgi:hypothetical protein
VKGKEMNRNLRAGSHFEKSAAETMVLMREPQNETEVNALIWKLKALRALPFETFVTLAHIGAAKGPDLLVNFQEDKASEPLRATTMKKRTDSITIRPTAIHRHSIPRFSVGMCRLADAKPRSTRPKNRTSSLSARMNTRFLSIALKYMDGIKVLSRKDLK